MTAASAWQTERLKHFAEVLISNVDKKSVPGEATVLLCNYRDVYYKDMIGKGLPFMEATASRGQIREFALRAGDVLITKDSETADDIGVPAYVQEDLDGILCGYHLAVIRPRRGRVNPKFLFWSFNSAEVRQQLSSRATGVTRFGVRQGVLADLNVCMPPVAQQQQIADFLDAETGRIDALAAARQQTLRLLQNRFWALFVGRVLTSRAPDVPLRRVVRAVRDGPFGSSFSSADYSDHGAFVVRLANIGFAEFRREPSAFVPLGLFDRFRQHEVQPGDVLIAGLGDTRNHAGRACVAPDLGPAMVKGKCFAARVDTKRANPEYLALLLSSPVGAELIAAESRGSTRSMINLDVVKSARLPMPSLDDQDEIVRTVELERLSQGRMVKAINRQIALLQERRQALITAAVSGEINVGRMSA